MQFLRRHRLMLAFALIACLVLLGRCAMRPNEAVNAPPRTERTATTASASANEQSSATDGAASSAVPSADNSASAFGALRGRVIDAVTRKPVREFEVQFHGTCQPGRRRR